MTVEQIPKEVKFAIAAAPGHFDGKVITKQEIEDYIEDWRTMLKSDENIELAIKKIEELFYIVMEGELKVMSDEDDHVEWFNTSTGQPIDIAGRDQHYWQHYRDYHAAMGKLGPNAIGEINTVTNIILSRLVDPINPADKWDKRGLVMGSVQSGKTANYTGLISKAIDSGYKFIVVLSGIHNDLRAQTQLRINDELLGYDMVQLDKASAVGSRNRVGVGKMFPKQKGRDIQTLTTSDEKGDFKKSAVTGVSPMLNGKHTYVLVVKKQVSVMKNLIEWLQKSAHAIDGKIRNVPMLLIDDECDQASINTKKKSETDEDGFEIEEPTKTNARIRSLLNTFDKSAYVGYTATPFANIFINSTDKHKELGEDLFPKDFIISLKRPSSYIGPDEFFGLKVKGNVSKGITGDSESKDADSSMNNDDDILKDYEEDLESEDELDEALPLQRGADDAEESYPRTQKKDDQVEKIPGTLKHAIKAYLLAVAARRIRKTSNVHSSMLIHVSRFQLIQEKTAALVRDLLSEYSARIQAPHEPLNDFKEIWEEDFMKTTKDVLSISKGKKKPGIWGKMTTITWEEILEVLPKVVGYVNVKELNGKSKDVLDYKVHQDKHGTDPLWEKRGLHAIVIGGNKLSRGLTLEGLTVSYYLRSSNMYDTLMQMGRWFGYRNGYLDLCRIYSTKEIFTNFGLVAIAEKDLREQFAKMADAGKTPREFGLYVLQSPGRLIVTNRGKSRHGTNLNISFRGNGPEITRFMPSKRQYNWNILENFIQELDKLKSPLPKTKTHNLHWKDIPRDVITSFLDDYESHVDQLQTTSALREFIKLQSSNHLKDWDVVFLRNKIRTPESSKIVNTSSNSHRLHVVKRTPTDYDAHKLAIKRIGSQIDEMLDFDDAMKNKITADFKAKRIADPDNTSETLTGAFIREYRDPSRGLLLIYLISNKDGKIHPYGGPKDKHQSDKPYFGYVVSFPGKGNFKTTAITANSTYMQKFHV